MPVYCRLLLRAGAGRVDQVDPAVLERPATSALQSLRGGIELTGSWMGLRSRRRLSLADRMPSRRCGRVWPGNTGAYR